MLKRITTLIIGLLFFQIFSLQANSFPENTTFKEEIPLLTCSITADVLGVFCDDNGTPNDPVDDYFFAEIMITGEETSATWVANDGTTGSYGETTIFGPFAINVEEVTLVFVDAEFADCTTSVTFLTPACAYDPGSSCIGTLPFEVLDIDNNEVSATIANEAVTIISGENNTGDLTFTVSNETAAQNSNVCVGVSVDNFTNISSAQFTISYDPAALVFLSVGNFNIPGLTVINFGTPPAITDGIITFSWAEFSFNGISINNGTEIFEVCFTATGNVGTYPLSIVGTPVAVEVFDVIENSVSATIVNGAVTITDGGNNTDDLIFMLSNETVAQNSNVCVSVSVDNFTNISSAQFTIRYNPLALTFLSVGNFHLPDLVSNNFGTPPDIPDGIITFSWTDLTLAGVDENNGTEIFEVCFTAIGNTGTYPVSIVGGGCVNFIRGNIFNDLDEDCLQTNGDLGLNDWTVRAYQDSTSIFYATTDEFGNYEIPVDTGDYVVSVLSGAYWLPCHNDSIIHLGYLDTINIDFPLQVEIECPLLTVDIGISAALRPCEAENYVFNYCNTGTTMAEDAYIEVTIDPLLLFNSASISPTEIEDNVYTFSLGDIESGACGSFTINVTPDCDSTELGMMLCMNAHIYPDSLCLPEFVNWEGAFLQVSAVCDEESQHLQFKVKNIGDAATSVPRSYVIIEDAILLMQGSLDEVDSGEIKDIPTTAPLPANGSTYHLYVQQEPGAPFAEEVSIAIEGCGTNESGSFSTGFFNQLPFYDEFFTSTFCTPLVGSYDPNDKQAIPTGYGEGNTIWQNVDLDYMIRFQNVGTDTAFRVVVIDTISQFLDPTTLRPGGSSHDYDFKIENAEDGSQAVLIFTFNDIQLVDSLTNEQGSQGFVNFKISQKRDNPIGTLIENEAGIYFDFNLPIITNQVWHTVGEHLFDVINGKQQTFIDEVEIKAYPNPFSERLTIEIKGLANQNVQLNLFDSSGRTVKQLAFENGKVEISAQGLTAGFYFYHIVSKEQLVGSGKLILK